MTRTDWFKSSYSNPAQDCVEVRFDRALVHVRDSKNPNGPTLAFGTVCLAELVSGIKAGRA